MRNTQRFTSVVEQAFSYGPEDEAAPGVLGFSFAELRQFLLFVTAKAHLDKSPIIVAFTGDSVKPAAWAKARAGSSRRTNYPFVAPQT